MQIQNFLATLLLLCLLAGCKQPPSAITISGILEGYKGEKVVLHRSKDRYGYRQWLSSLDTCDVSKEGEFTFTVSLGESDFFQVVSDEGHALFSEVYLEPGDSIYVHVPIRSDSTRTTYAGAYAGAYDVRDRLDSLWKNDATFKPGYYEIAQMDIDSAWTFLRNRHHKKMSLVNAHFNGHPEWKPFYDQNRTEIIYRSAQEHYQYLYYHNYYTRDTFLYMIPEAGYYGFLDSIDISSCPEYFSYNYLSFLSDFLRDHMHRDNAEMSDSLLYANMFQLMLDAAKKHLDGKPRDMALLAITNDFPHYLAMDNFFEMVDSMEAYFELHRSSDMALEQFRHVKAEFESLRPGNKAPELALPDVNGDTVRLSDLTGKVVYLDFWGTWCYPCLQELPYSLELEGKFTDQPVEFVYIGLESGEDQLTTWKEFILGESGIEYAPFLEQRVYPGIHLLAEGQFGNPALRPFKIGAAPTYILIDAKGNIVSANAPRPSSDEIEGLIRETLTGT